MVEEPDKDTIYVSLEQLTSSLDILNNRSYHEVEEYRQEINYLDIVVLAVSELTQTEATRSIGSADKMIKYRMERYRFVQFSSLISIWEDMICVLIHYTTDMSVSPDSQKQCYKCLLDLVKFSLNDNQLFSVMHRKLEYILGYIPGSDSEGFVDKSELIEELGERWGMRGDEVSITGKLQYWSTSNDVKKLKLALLQRDNGVACVEQLANKCYVEWYGLIQAGQCTGEVTTSHEIGNKLTQLQRVSCDVVGGIEVLFRIMLCLGEERCNSNVETTLNIMDSVFEFINEVHEMLKMKSTIPNKMIELVWLVLAMKPTNQLITKIHNLLHHIVPKIVKREAGVFSSNNLALLIDSLFFYVQRCLQQQELDICYSVTSLHQSIINMSSNSFHNTFIAECFRLAAFSFASQTESKDIFKKITEFTDTFLQTSTRGRSAFIKLLANLCIEICLAGDNPVQCIQLLLDVIVQNESHKYSQGLTRRMRDLVKAITRKLNSNCISIHDTIQTLIPSVSRIASQLSTMLESNRVLLTIRCCSQLITRTSSIHDFEILLRHGMPLIEQIMPREFTVKEASCFFKKVIERFLNRKDTYLLQLAHIVYEKLTKQFKNEYHRINTLFYYLLIEAPLSKISYIYHACETSILSNNRLSPLHSIFYIQTMQPAILKIFADISTTLCFMLTNRYCSIKPPLLELVYSCVNDIIEVIQHELTDARIWQQSYERVMLLSFIFMGVTDPELDNPNHYKQNLLLLLDTEMPVQLEQLIVTIMERIIYIDLQFYSPLQSRLIQLMVRSMYGCRDIPKNRGNESIQFDKVNVLENIEEMINEVQFNHRTIKELISSGYNSNLFKYNIQQQVQVHTGLANYAQDKSVLARFREFQHILKTINIGVYWFSHNKVYLYDIFTGELSPDQLEDRVRYAKMYLFKYVNKSNALSNQLKAVHALEEERGYVHSRKTKNNIPSRHTLTITLLTQFYHTLISSRDSIDPSVRPLGSHNEIPLEVAIRRDRGVVSIRDSYSNEEVERCEVVFMIEGLYLMESQTNGHGVDTSLAWCQLFAKLLTTDRLVPSIILPRGCPTMDTWKHVNESVCKESMNSNLTWCPYYSYEWVTHYPTTPEKVYAMEDIVLHPGYRVYSGGVPQNMTPVWGARTDLLGVLFRHVLTSLSQIYLTSVHCNYADYIYSFLKNLLIEPDNENFNSHTDLEEDIIVVVNNWILSVDLDELFQTDNRAFFELKYFLDAHSASSIKKYKRVRADIKIIITDSFHTFVLNELPYEIQRAAMLWIEQVDDKLWNETERLEEPFRYLLNHTEEGLKSFPGIVCFFLPQYRGSPVPIIKEVLTPDRISGYVVGKVVELDLREDVLNNDRRRNNQLNEGSMETFEVWGTWIEPRFRRLGIAIDMYRYTLKVLPTHYLTLDMKEGVQWKCAVNVKTGCLLMWLGIVDYIMENIVAKEVPSRWNFYLGSDDRIFQRYLINNKFIRPFVYIDTAVNYCNKRYARWKRNIPFKLLYSCLLIALFVLLSMGML